MLLDATRATTALIPVAKTHSCLLAWPGDGLELTYRAWVFGIPGPVGTLVQPGGEKEGAESPKHVEEADEEGEGAASGEEVACRCTVLRHSDDATKAWVEIVHRAPRRWLARAGYPVVGDGKAAKAAGIPSKEANVRGLYLALVSLACRHPVDPETRVAVEVQEPSKFAKLGKAREGRG